MQQDNPQKKTQAKEAEVKQKWETPKVEVLSINESTLGGAVVDSAVRLTTFS